MITLRGQEKAQKRVDNSEECVGGIGDGEEGGEPLVEKDGDLIISAPSSRHPRTETKARICTKHSLIKTKGRTGAPRRGQMAVQQYGHQLRSAGMN